MEDATWKKGDSVATLPEAITGREGGLAPAACSQETWLGLAVPIVETVKQRGQAHLPDLLFPLRLDKTRFALTFQTACSHSCISSIT